MKGLSSGLSTAGDALAMKASGSTSYKKRLREHAARYHRKSHNLKAAVIRKYSRKLQGFDTAAVRKHAAHVAAWIAYRLRDPIPDLRELKLLQKFVKRLGTGILPSRLKEVLPNAQAVLQSMQAHQVSEAWHEAESKLQQGLQKFRCCRAPKDKVGKRGRNSKDVEVESHVTTAAERKFSAHQILVSHDDLTVADSEAEPQDIEKPGVDAESSSPPPKQHLQLFNKINEWGFLDDSQRLERLKKAEAAMRPSSTGLDEAALANAVQTAVAALSAPRRRASVDASANEGFRSHIQKAGLAVVEGLFFSAIFLRLFFWRPSVSAQERKKRSDVYVEGKQDPKP